MEVPDPSMDHRRILQALVLLFVSVLSTFRLPVVLGIDAISHMAMSQLSEARIMRLPLRLQHRLGAHHSEMRHHHREERTDSPAEAAFEEEKIASDEEDSAAEEVVSVAISIETSIVEIVTGTGIAEDVQGRVPVLALGHLEDVTCLPSETEVNATIERKEEEVAMMRTEDGKTEIEDGTKRGLEVTNQNKKMPLVLHLL